MTPERAKEIKASAIKLFEEYGSENVIWQVLHGSQGSPYQGEEGLLWGCIAAEMERRWKADAARYRWLRSQSCWSSPDDALVCAEWNRGEITSEQLDAAIDATMRAEA